MAYRIELYAEAEEQISTLPATALPALAEAMVMVELTPWNGAPLYKDKPSGEVRTLPFGTAGMVTYLILEYDQEVYVISVVWAD